MHVIKRDILKDLIAWKEEKTGRVLELSGARQVGKTFILERFAKDNFEKSIYINCAGETGRLFTKYLWDALDVGRGNGSDAKYSTVKALKAYDAEFVDDEKTIVIIDEIQESSHIYNRIRDFARLFKCYFVVTGSYLGKLLDKEFFMPAGDLDRLTMYTVTFPEFLSVFDLRETYESLELFGGSNPALYDTMQQYFNVYLRIGGYPAAVADYKEHQDIKRCEKIKANIIETFINESTRYFEGIQDVDVISKSLNAIALTRINEKDGVRNLSEELCKIVYQEEAGRTNKKIVNNVIAWLKQSNIIGYCSKAIDADFNNVMANSRYYFMDVGIAEYFFKNTRLERNKWKGIIAENFVYLSLLRNSTMLGDEPYFATYSKTNGELDFLVSNEDDDAGYVTYGIEVKYIDGPANTALALLKDRKIDYVYILKGKTYGGIHENVLTVPLYLVDRLDFTRPPERE